LLSSQVGLLQLLQLFLPRPAFFVTSSSRTPIRRLVL
jgi:hypothetical protein